MRLNSRGVSGLFIAFEVSKLFEVNFSKAIHVVHPVYRFNVIEPMLRTLFPSCVSCCIEKTKCSICTKTKYTIGTEVFIYKILRFQIYSYKKYRASKWFKSFSSMQIPTYIEKEMVVKPFGSPLYMIIFTRI